MVKVMKTALNKLMRTEQGQALPIVLILLLLGGLIISPFLGYMGTGIKAGMVHETRMEELYAADAGAEDALWKIKYDQIPAVLPYSLATINGKTVTVDIDTVWLLAGLESPANGTMPHAELVATGRLGDAATGRYDVIITYDGSNGNVFLERIGVWLPIGFNYNGSPSGVTTKPPATASFRGGTTVIWDLQPRVKLPTGVSSNKTQSFYITPTGQDPVGDFAWVRTTRMDIYLSWDADFLTYTITATAPSADGNSTEVVANVSKEIGAVPYPVGMVTYDIKLQ